MYLEYKIIFVLKAKLKKCQYLENQYTEYIFSLNVKSYKRNNINT